MSGNGIYSTSGNRIEIIEQGESFTLKITKLTKDRMEVYLEYAEYYMDFTR
ncbi:MAG: hypothetical protein LBC68_06450 [Prevotellaceae bacterium]|jgi:hypothetical protein|nr:hypothetical protein [Prevotellaceae bacterium]